MERGVSSARTPEERINIMRQGVGLKVFYNPDVAQVLAATGDEEIYEGNDWGDRFWGVDPPASGDGENHLGCILMEHREILRRSRGISIDI